MFDEFFFYFNSPKYRQTFKGGHDFYGRIELITEKRRKNGKKLNSNNNKVIDLLNVIQAPNHSLLRTACDNKIHTEKWQRQTETQHVCKSFWKTKPISRDHRKLN